MVDPELERGKKIEWYSQLVGAWINSSFEKDKAIISLATASLGAELTYFLTNESKLFSTSTLVLFVLSTISLAISIVAVLFAFELNKKHVEIIMSESGESSIGWIDRLISYSFAFGVLLATLNFTIIVIDTRLSHLASEKINCIDSRKTDHKEQNSNENNFPDKSISIQITNENQNSFPSRRVNLHSQVKDKCCCRNDSILWKYDSSTTTRLSR